MKGDAETPTRLMIMIKTVKGGYKVYSESGKTLSRIYPTKTQAEKRLAQIHYHSKKK